MCEESTERALLRSLDGLNTSVTDNWLENAVLLSDKYMLPVLLVSFYAPRGLREIKETGSRSLLVTRLLDDQKSNGNFQN